MKKSVVYKISLIANLTLFVFAYFVLVVSNVHAQVATLSLSPASGTFRQGCNVSIDVKVDTGGAQTDGTDVILFYEPTKLAASSITNGTIYSDYPGNAIDSTGSKITVSGVSSISSPFSGAGTLASINFTVPQSAPLGTTTLKFDFAPTDKSKTTDSNVVQRGTVTDILGQVTDGIYTIAAGPCSGATQTSTNTTSVSKPFGGPETTTVPLKQLPEGGLSTPTLALVIVGGFLTILGIAGLALL